MANTVRDDWPGRYARVVAAEVRRHREARGMSAQQLSDACAQLGHPIHRSVLANFENGRRSNLDLGETMVIAKALGIAPVLLMVPGGPGPVAELLPGQATDRASAIAWIVGAATPEQLEALEVELTQMQSAIKRAREALRFIAAPEGAPE